MNIYLKYFWIITAIPAGIIAAMLLGLWANFIGNDVRLEMIGAFIGIVGAFVVLQIIQSLINPTDL